MRIALLSNVAAEVLARMLGREHSVWCAPGFGAWMQAALSPDAGLAEFGPDAIFLLLDSSFSPVDRDGAECAVSALEAAFPRAVVSVPDIDGLAAATDGFYDERMRELYSMPWSKAGLLAIEKEIGRILRSSLGARKKVLALDFDNTLWAGVAGEDGAEGIEPYSEFQRGLKRLKDGGVLLAGLSKNNAADIDDAWRADGMVLAPEDFAASRIDWNDKPANLRSIASELNLGTDAFVFVDDNPAERERMKSLCPEVAVPDFPSSAAGLASFLRDLERLYFPETRATAEDAARTRFYADEASRRRFAAKAPSAEAYLKGLGMWIAVRSAEEGDVARIAQLSQKANQFNVLTCRRTEDEISSFIRDETHVVLSARAGDRFGDMGLIAFVHAVKDGETAEIADWVMSCRAMSRRLEHAIEDRFEKFLFDAGVRRIRARWRRTAKNSPTEFLFESFGFRCLGETGGCKSYEFDLPRTVALEHCARIEDGTAGMSPETEEG